ncbi:MAG: hypothetical protein H7251_09765 [Acetobacteraceae bacterium]|nr:hypothetical protein [Acetobacteraceae bacterium]
MSEIAPFPPTPAAALLRLAAFVTGAGRDYAQGRNSDPGPGHRDSVSLMSPDLRHRVITERDVATSARAMTEALIPPPTDLPVVAAPLADGPALLLVTPEDLHPESGFGQTSGFAGVLVVSGAATGSERSLAFVAGAAADTSTRAGAYFNCPVQMIDMIDPATLCAPAAEAEVDTIVTAYAPVGPVADALAKATAVLQESGVALAQVRRFWDVRFWPRARKGFFAFKDKVPPILAQEGLC